MKIKRPHWKPEEYEALGKYIAERLAAGEEKISSAAIDEIGIVKRHNLNGINSELLRWKDASNGFINKGDNKNKAKGLIKVNKRRVIMAANDIKLSGDTIELPHVLQKPEGHPRSTTFYSNTPPKAVGTFVAFNSTEVDPQIEARDQFDALVQMALRFQSAFTSKQESIIVENLIDLRDLLNANEFIPENLPKLKKMEWINGLNVRHGADSIHGMVGELFALALLSLKRHWEKFDFGKGDRHSEVNGCDLVCDRRSESWQRLVTIQVKTVPNLEGLIVYKKYLDYNNITRIVFVDLNHDRLITIDYATFKRHVKAGQRLSIKQLLRMTEGKQSLYTA